MPSLLSDFRLVLRYSFPLFSFIATYRKVGRYVIICVKVSTEKVHIMQKGEQPINSIKRNSV